MLLGFHIAISWPSTIFLLVIAFSLIVVQFSNFLLRYPNLIHKRKKHGSRFSKIIGHRGSTQEGLPENTIAAFKDAVLFGGCDTVELDVWLAKDGEVVVHHDELLSRMTKGACNDKIGSLPSTSLPKIIPSEGQFERCPKILDDDFSPRDELNSSSEWQRIPLLRDVLKELPSHITLIIEIKQDSDELIHLVDQLLEKFNRSNNVYWFSLSEPINRKLQQRRNDIPTIASTFSMIRLLAAYYVGILPFLPITESVYGVPMFEVSYDDIREDHNFSFLPDFVIRLLVVLCGGRPPKIFFVPKFYVHLRSRGIAVFMLGVNTDKDVACAVKLGATGAISDKPTWLRKYMKENSTHFPRPKQ